MKRKNRGGIVIMFSMILLLTATRSPGVNHMRMVDFLELYAAGAAFGAGVAMTVAGYKNRQQDTA
jgi:hypothetical protein